MLVRYGSRCEIRSTQILNVPYRTAILGHMALLLYFVLLTGLNFKYFIAVPCRVALYFIIISQLTSICWNSTSIWGNSMDREGPSLESPGQPKNLSTKSVCNTIEKQCCPRVEDRTLLRTCRVRGQDQGLQNVSSRTSSRPRTSSRTPPLLARPNRSPVISKILKLRTR